MNVQRCIVDNRMFLLSLDRLYRDAMKRHEREELLPCARRIAQALDVAPADVPIEGYYAEDAELTEWFRLVRGLQRVPKSRRPEVAALPAFQRLLTVTSAPLYGCPQHDSLLPVGRDPLSEALLTEPDWNVPRLTQAAGRVAHEIDDFSLVGLAARGGDAVVLAAVRESVVLFAETIVLGIPRPTRREFVWNVDADLARHAARFVDAFNALFGDELPPPDAEHAGSYWYRHHDDVIHGRCARLGTDATGRRHYHWAIRSDVDGTLGVEDFWDSEVWTTERYRAEQRDHWTEHHPEIARLTAELIVAAWRQRATEISLEHLPSVGRGPGDLIVRFRIDGELRDYERIPGRRGKAVVRRFKHRGGLLLTEPSVAQPGRFVVRLPQVEIELRVSTMTNSDGNDGVAVLVHCSPALG